MDLTKGFLDTLAKSQSNLRKLSPKESQELLQDLGDALDLNMGMRHWETYKHVDEMSLSELDELAAYAIKKHAEKERKMAANELAFEHEEPETDFEDQRLSDVN